MDIIVYHHLGLGDHFICNALVLHLAEKYDNLHLISWNHNLPTVKHLYSDSKNVHVHGIEDEGPALNALRDRLKLPMISIGFGHCDVNNFESSFYNQLRLPPSLQYSGFKLPSDNINAIKMYDDYVSENGTEYIFVHDTSSVGKYKLDIESDLPRYTVDKSQTSDVLDYVELISKATEIHIINSSIQAVVWPMLYQHLIPNAKIFYHNVRTSQQGGARVNVPESDQVTKVTYEKWFTI